MLKLLRKKDSALEDVLKELEKTRRLRGFYHRHAWQFVVGKPNAGGFDIISEGVWRRNPERPEIFAAWRDEASLMDFLKKKHENQMWVQAQTLNYEARNPKVKTQWPAMYAEQIRGIERRVPNPWQTLSTSNDVAFEFQLERTQHLVWHMEQKLRSELGLLPTKASYVAWTAGLHGIQPVLKICWKGD
jgi:hypothetical protein